MDVLSLYFKYLPNALRNCLIVGNPSYKGEFYIEPTLFTDVSKISAPIYQYYRTFSTNWNSHISINNLPTLYNLKVNCKL